MSEPTERHERPTVQFPRNAPNSPSSASSRNDFEENRTYSAVVLPAKLDRVPPKDGIIRPACRLISEDLAVKSGIVAFVESPRELTEGEKITVLLTKIFSSRRAGLATLV